MIWSGTSGASPPVTALEWQWPITYVAIFRLQQVFPSLRTELSHHLFLKRVFELWALNELWVLRARLLLPSIGKEAERTNLVRGRISGIPLIPESYAVYRGIVKRRRRLSLFPFEASSIRPQSSVLLLSLNYCLQLCFSPEIRTKEQGSLCRVKLNSPNNFMPVLFVANNCSSWAVSLAQLAQWEDRNFAGISPWTNRYSFVKGKNPTTEVLKTRKIWFRRKRSKARRAIVTNTT